MRSSRWILPADIKVCIVADRGFGDQKLYRMLTEELKFDYVIRFRGNITVTTTAGETRTAAAFVGPGGRARVLRGAWVTADRYQVGTVLCVQDKEMKQAWCLAASSTSATSRALMRLYGKRWGIESGLRDAKDPRFGMGMGSVHVSTPERRDRLWLINGLAVVIWSYPRGSGLSKDGETAIDVVGYAVQIAAQLGAHIIKVKLPTAHIEQEAARKVYDERRIPIATPTERVRHVLDCTFAGRRIVIFSGGAAVFDDDKLLDEIRSIHDGGGFGSIIGRNSFQRPKEEALRMLGSIMDIYAAAPERTRTH